MLVWADVSVTVSGVRQIPLSNNSCARNMAHQHFCILNWPFEWKRKKTFRETFSFIDWYSLGNNPAVSQKVL